MLSESCTVTFSTHKEPSHLKCRLKTQKQNYRNCILQVKCTTKWLRNEDLFISHYYDI